MPRRSYRKRRLYKRSTRRRTKKTAMRKIVKRTIMSLAETKKKYQNVIGSGLSNNAWKGTNLLYWIGQGTDDHTRIGDKIQLRGIKMKASFVPSLTPTIGYPSIFPYMVRIVCWKYKTNLSAGLTGAEWGSSVAPPTIGGTGLTALIDTEKCTVAFDKVYKGTTNINLNRTGNDTIQTAPYVFVNHYWKINKSIQYAGDNSGYLKGDNYLISYYASWPSSESLTYVEMNTCTYFKDI